ncbi:unnamed protein product, partial [marine sediment metagenome]
LENISQVYQLDCNYCTTMSELIIFLEKTWHFNPILVYSIYIF